MKSIIATCLALIICTTVKSQSQPQPQLPQLFMATTINSTNFPGLFSSPVTKTVKASGGDYTTLQAAFNAIHADAPNCNEIITVDAGYTASSLGSGSTLTYQYTCPANSYVWVRSSAYASLPSQGQTVCTTSISSVSENAVQTIATITTSRDLLLSTGALARLKGIANTDFDGDFTITRTGANTYTVPNTQAAANASSSGGTVIPMNLYLSPSDCPDVPNMFVVAKAGGGTYDQAVYIADDSVGGNSSSGLIITGMELSISGGATTYIGVGVGTANGTDAAYVNHVILDRIYVYSPVSTNFGRGVTLQGPWQALVDSYIDGLKDTSGSWAETHGVYIYFANGPYKIVDNYIGGIPTEVILSGGTGVGVANGLPTDVEIRTNTLFSDFANRIQTLSKKNCFEMKAGQRVLFDGNTCYYSWVTLTSPQYGTMMAFNNVNQYGECTWCVDQDFTITNNDFQHMGAEFVGTQGFGEQGAVSTVQTRMSFSNNLFRDMSNATYNTGLGGGNVGGWTTSDGATVSGPSSGANYTTMSHNGFYGAASNANYLATFDLYGGCTLRDRIPNWTYHANITLFDNEVQAQCFSTIDGQYNAGLFTNLIYTGNVHVGYPAADFSTQPNSNMFPSGSAANPPAGMFNRYSICVAATGAINSCALQPGSAYHNNNNCDNADCGPNIATLIAGQTVANDSTAWGPRNASSLRPAPPYGLTVTVW